MIPPGLTTRAHSAITSDLAGAMWPGP
jgi:hypothetical protein